MTQFNVRGGQAGVQDGQKINVTIKMDTKVVQKAKADGHNMSAEAETFFRALTFDVPRDYTRNEAIGNYTALFSLCKFPLYKYDIRIKVGQIPNFPKSGKTEYVYLHPLGDLMVFYDPLDKNDRRVELDYPIADALDYLYSPIIIVENLLEALTQATQDNKEKFKEMSMALRIVRAIADVTEIK